MLKLNGCFFIEDDELTEICIKKELDCALTVMRLHFHDK